MEEYLYYLNPSQGEGNGFDYIAVPGKWLGWGAFVVGTAGIGLLYGAAFAGTSVWAYASWQAGLAVVDTGVEWGLAGLTGEEYNPLAGLAKNTYVNFATAGVGTGGKWTARVGKYALKQALRTGADTAIDVGVHDRQLGTALASNGAGNLLGDGIGYVGMAGLRRAASHVGGFADGWLKPVANDTDLLPHTFSISRPSWPNWRARQGGLLKGDNLAHPGYEDEVMVIGRLASTEEFVGMEGFNVLKQPIWDIHVNDGWVTRGIMEKRIFLLATMPSISTLRQPPKLLPDGSIVRDTTVFFRELKMLRDAGYTKRMLPDGKIYMCPKV